MQIILVLLIANIIGAVCASSHPSMVGVLLWLVAIVIAPAFISSPDRAQ